MDLAEPGTFSGNFYLMTLSYCFKKMLLAKKFFEFHARVQKCHFTKSEKLPKWLIEPLHYIQFFFWAKNFQKMFQDLLKR
jgi:hypothetical protein